jgi:hypothetical protein
MADVVLSNLVKRFDERHRDQFRVGSVPRLGGDSATPRDRQTIYMDT